MTWDSLNRMTSFISGSTITDYAYGADGMRVSKASGTQAVTYGCDGQMQVEECFADSGAPRTDYATRYGLGARGIDRMEKTTGSGTSVGYPVYDAHGNMIATLAESGSSYSLGNQRSYDAWGGIRSGSTTGGPSPRHCASPGHVQDDESELVYMRARYYDASSARFLSEDPKLDGLNCYTYAKDDPVDNVDDNGKDAKTFMLMMSLLMAYYGVVAVMWEPNSPHAKAAKLILDPTFGALVCLAPLAEVTQAATEMDPQECPGLVYSAICLTLLGLVLCAIAAYQLSMLVFMDTEGDFGLSDGEDFSDGLGEPNFIGSAAKIANEICR